MISSVGYIFVYFQIYDYNTGHINAYTISENTAKERILKNFKYDLYQQFWAEDKVKILGEDY